jgi:hypothetical protein
MKTTIAVISILSMTVPAAAREAGDIAEWRREMREIRVKEPQAVLVAPAPVDAKGCALMKLDDVVISRGAFSNDLTIEAKGSKIGEIENTGSGWVIKNGSAVAARTSGSAVLDCSGAVIGYVEELAGPDSSSYAIKDAAGNIVAASGAVDDGDMVLKGNGGMIAVRESGFFSSNYKVDVSGVDARLAAVAVAVNNAAQWRRSAQRRRDNPREPHGGRGDR